ncbi:Rpn family recombination-promoting nuclease/putative transposase [Prevotella sp. PINT]|jgi:conserved hypothetical protein (putative transposase or invertase)|nr:Rpn family recombination-promoting nuclease/putative transposase [Palleniella intestinalis]NPD83056.1 Rpn family recombination-promoting nuclease/putative transposase [Palleniella intestinalis]
MLKKYLDPKADLTFKRVFGDHPDLVISLLNALLPFDSKEEEIESVEYLPTELVPDNPLRKNSIVDVRCRDNQGRQFLVEMQMIWSREFTQRVLFNSAKAYVRQMDSKDDYKLLEPVYSLNLVNDVFEKDVPEYYHYYRMVHELYSEKVIDGLHLVFVELPKFKPHTFSEKKMQVLWLRYLTEIEEKTIDVPQEFLDNPDIRKALTVVEESAYTPAQLLGYDKFWDIIRTEKTYYNSAHRHGYAKGHAEGIAEGMEKGIAEGMEKGMAEGELKGAEKEKRDTLIRMQKAGTSIDIMSIATGLSAEEVKRLLNL